MCLGHVYISRLLEQSEKVSKCRLAIVPLYKVINSRLAMYIYIKSYKRDYKYMYVKFSYLQCKAHTIEGFMGLKANNWAKVCLFLLSLYNNTRYKRKFYLTKILDSIETGTFLLLSRLYEIQSSGHWLM